MKKLLLCLTLLLITSVTSSPAIAIHFSLNVSNQYPDAGETTEVEVFVNNMPGTDFWGMDFCVNYDSAVLDVNSVLVNDDAAGGCIASVFTIIVDDDAGCLRVGGGKMPGTTCPFAGDYKIATIVFQALNTDGTMVCATLNCDASGCSHNFAGFVHDETGKYEEGATSDGCVSISTLSNTTTAFTTSSTTFSSSTTTTSPANTTSILISSTSSMNIITTTIKNICAIEEMYGENSYETQLLRSIKDEILSKTPEGQEIIKLYYNHSSSLAKAMEGDELLKERVKEIIDTILSLIAVQTE